MSEKNKAIIAVLSVLAAACFSYVGWFVFKQYYIPLQDEKEVEEVRDIYSMITDEEKEDVPKVEFECDDYGQLGKVPLTTSQETADADSSLDKVREIYGDIVAWIYIPGTTVDYPVVKGEDNSYYLNHNHNGQYTANGAIFMDSQCDSESQNVVIYGHNMNANIMFTDLMKMKSRDFGLEHKTFYLDLNDGGTTEWTLIAAFACSDSTAESFIQPTFTKDSIGEWLVNINDMRYYDTNVSFDEKDQYATLITCSYEGNNYRTIVIAKRGS